MSSTHILVFANQKGGVGKTTSCINVADALAREGAKVLLIDLDPQSNSTSIFIDSDVRPKVTITDVLLAKEAEVLPVFDQAIITTTNVAGVHIIPANLRLASVETKLREGTLGSPAKFLKKRIAHIKARYDWIVIDAPPTLGLLPANALACATLHVVPFEGGDAYGLDGADDLEFFANEIRDDEVNPDLKTVGAIITKYKSRQQAHKVTDDLIAERYPILGRITDSSAASKAALMRQTVLKFDRSSAPSRDYIDLTRKIMEIAGWAPVKERKARGNK